MAQNISSQNCSYLTRRIRGTTYKVRVVFSETSQETLAEKILRIVRNEVLDQDGKCGIMTVPQMSRQSERSAS
ncbi:MAG: transposon-encoded TnpW family protein [Faecousia sp.]